MVRGDRVKLNGYDQPVMVVRYVRYAVNNQESKIIGVVCEWFDLDMRLHQHEFNPESLYKDK